MNRKEFLGAVALLGGASLIPSSVIQATDRPAPAKKDKRKFDPSKTVLLSDIHISGEFNEEGTPVKYPYNPTCLNLRIGEILAMKPLPANVIVFGDVAWDYGLEEDYVYARQLLQPLEEAGIQVTLALGNHDRREGFFKVFPEYAERTPVPGRAVSVISLPEVDMVMLDSLAELPDLKRRQKTTVSGEIDDAQIEWLKGFLEKSTKPVIIGAHHPLKEMTNLTNVISESDKVAGYIFGHKHVWNKSTTILRPRKRAHIVPTLGLPATFYGDIGFAVMHTSPDAAVIEFTSKGFWWPQPAAEPPREWIQREKDLQNEKCTFVL